MNIVLRFLYRTVPALVLIFSGLVKAIDPIGGAIKFDDYFTAFNLNWLTPLSLPLSVILSSFEFLLGFYLLLNFYVRKLALIALTTISFFTILTLYIAVFEPVTDCGCFGDAIKLSNWQTFWKNVVVVLFTIGLFISRKQYKNSVGSLRMIFGAITPAIYILGLCWWGINKLPVIDFRPFKVGTHIPSQMEIPDGAERDEFETVFILEKDGVKKTFTTLDYPYDDSTWIFIDTETKVIKKGYEPPLRDFYIMNSYLEDETQKIINHEGAVFLVISPRIEKISQRSIMPLARLAELSQQKEIPFYVVTTSGSATGREFNLENKTNFRFLHADETTLKTMVRSNPGLILLFNGTIIGKWHYNKLPGKNIVENPLAGSIGYLTRKNVLLLVWGNILGLIIVPTLIFNIKTINKKK